MKIKISGDIKMKPDKKKESITEEYQRPPLLEEIKKFK